jgi:hypothetical protein
MLPSCFATKHCIYLSYFPCFPNNHPSFSTRHDYCNTISRGGWVMKFVFRSFLPVCWGSGIFASEPFFWRTLIFWAGIKMMEASKFIRNVGCTSATLQGVTSQEQLVSFIPWELEVSLLWRFCFVTFLLRIKLDVGITYE